MSAEQNPPAPNFSLMNQIVRDTNGNEFGRLQSLRYSTGNNGTFLSASIVSTRNPHIVYETPMMRVTGIPDRIIVENNDIVGTRTYALHYDTTGQVTVRADGPINAGDRVRLIPENVIGIEDVSQLDDESRQQLTQAIENMRPGENYRVWHDQSQVEPEPKLIYPDLTCAGCKSHIHQPENLPQFLKPNELAKYIEYCKRRKVEPTLFCCGCFDVAKNSKYLMVVWKKMIQEYNDLENTERALNGMMTRCETNLRKVEELKEYYQDKVDDLKRNPLRVMILEWTGFNLRRKEKKPKLYGKSSLVNKSRKIGLTTAMATYNARDITPNEFTREYLCSFTIDEEELHEQPPKFSIWDKICGKVLVHDPIRAETKKGYHVFAIGFHQFKAGGQFKAKVIHIPIPFVMQNHHLFWMQDTKRFSIC